MRFLFSEDYDSIYIYDSSDIEIKNQNLSSENSGLDSYSADRNLNYRFEYRNCTIGLEIRFSNDIVVG